MALVMVGFLLGGKLTLPSLREHGRLVLWVSITAVVVTVLIVGVGLVLVGVPLEIALVLPRRSTSFTSPDRKVRSRARCSASSRWTTRGV
jgi:hypothetical protein